jgi:hypothetical protein
LSSTRSPFHAIVPRRGATGHQATQQRGLADAVAAEQRGDLARFRLQRHAAQDVAAAVVLVEIGNVQHEND